MSLTRNGVALTCFKELQKHHKVNILLCKIAKVNEQHNWV